ncbi:NAD(P)H-dependent glycerol-3-phosphate dehydrogenase [Rothia sp. ZJ932]|uniref:NAD(P)H-dependent glycerol-3-phosphate dehydrogenase n=1 Tax=Rothia sp. ZJ932 TaxID=2810516 RepID=UPI002103C430|nr:NAD(P)H-dependent glycerol-3-phosphate dehydrogenase [Rothia sp. ZJ932]
MTALSTEKVAVMGAGSWGTAFAKIVADTAAQTQQNLTVSLWGRNVEAMASMSASGINERYFPEVQLPAGIEYTSDTAAALKGAGIVVLAVPAQSLRENLKNWGTQIEPGAVLVSLAKGLEGGTGYRMSEVITEVLTELGNQNVVQRVTVLSGPNLAREIVQEEPTASVIAAPDEPTAARVATVCANGYFRPYTNTDIVGVEIGGLVKNVIALCVGMCEGKNYGDNSKASVMTRGLAETTRLALALGGKLETMSGLAGMGDLIATCSSPLSRNHTAGKLLAQGIDPDQLGTVMTQTAESVKTAPVVAQLAHRLGIEMPITEAVVAVLSHKITVDELAPALLGRTLKSEANH